MVELEDTLRLGRSAFGHRGSNPRGTTKFADVVELEDTLGSKPSALWRAGSIPAIGTTERGQDGNAVAC